MKKMTKTETQNFKILFNKFCDQEISEGHCVPDGCESCEIHAAMVRVFGDAENE